MEAMTKTQAVGYWTLIGGDWAYVREWEEIEGHPDGGHFTGTIYLREGKNITSSWTRDGRDCDGYTPWDLKRKGRL